MTNNRPINIQGMLLGVIGIILFLFFVSLVFKNVIHNKLNREACEKMGDVYLIYEGNCIDAKDLLFQIK